MSRRSLALGLLYLLAVALLVLTPISRELNAVTVLLYVWWTYTFRLPGDPLPEDFGFALNVMMFLPLGLMVVLSTRRSWRVAVLVAVALSATIELVQGLPLVDRTPSVSDVISNSLGGFFGAMLALALRRTSSQRRDVG